MPETIVMKRNRNGEFVQDYIENDEQEEQSVHPKKRKRKKSSLSLPTLLVPEHLMQSFIVPPNKRRKKNSVEVITEIREGFQAGREFVKDVQRFLKDLERGNF